MEVKDQIERLRSLIQGEIRAALMNENGCMWAFEVEKENNKQWEKFEQLVNGYD